MVILQNGVDSCPGHKHQHLEEAGEDAADLASALDSAPTRGLLFSTLILTVGTGIRQFPLLLLLLSFLHGADVITKSMPSFTGQSD